MKRTLTIILAIAAAFSYQAQSTKTEIFADINKTGGVYYAYPTPASHLSAAPTGFQPFYISHFGRHGSRWLINDVDFLESLDLLRKASASNALSPTGLSALQRLEKVWKLAEGHNGDLTDLGAKQQRQISDRMFKNYTSVFQGSPKVTAKSTVVPRCILSMAYFANELTANNPNLKVAMESSDKYMKYLNHHTPESNVFRDSGNFWQEEKRKFKKDNIVAGRFVNNLFTSEDYIYKNVNPEKLMEAFYWIASDMQNIETDISFYDLFTKDELFNIYQAINYQTYVNDGPSPLSNGLIKNNAIPLVKNILDEANSYISSNGNGASIRFGHDGNILPLLALLNVEGANKEELNPANVYQVWNTFQNAPMAGNLQMIFYKNKKKEVLVKFLLNENEVHIPIETKMFPYYQWSDVQSYLEAITKR